MNLLRLKSFFVTLLGISAVSGQSQPHIVFVLADDYGFHDISYREHSEIITPNLEILANSGVKLENYYVQPSCSPTRSQLMTGRYQIHTGVSGVIKNSFDYGLPLDEPTIADKLKEAGYSTHMVGKWHLGFYQEAYTPWKRGFDTFFGLLGGAEDHYTHTSNYKGTPYLDLRHNDEPTYDYDNLYSTDIFSDEAASIIANHDTETPMFLYLAYPAVHSPLQVPDEIIDTYYSRGFTQNDDRKTYAAMVTAMDTGIQTVVDALQNNGMWENTIFIFSSDNGGAGTEGASNYPLRGQKGNYWEGGIRSTGFVTGKGVSGLGEECHELVHITDWFPTLVHIAGGNLNGTKELDGQNLWDTVSECAQSTRDVLLHHIDLLANTEGESVSEIFDTTITAAIRAGDYKLLTGDPGNSGYELPPELRRDLDAQEDTLDKDKNVWLFNISDDPTESTDISEDNPEIVDELLTLLAEFQAGAVTPSNPRANPGADPALNNDVWGPWQ